MNKKTDFKITQVHIYHFKNDNYYVSFKTPHGVENIYGKRDFVLQRFALRVKSILRLR